MFSMFVIAAAVMLVALLFRLGIDQRADQVGIFLAVGIGRRRTLGMLALEGLIVSALASLVGVGLGIGYAALMLAGLRTWWLAAVVTPFLRLQFTALTPLYLSIGYASGVMVAFGTIAWSLYRTRRMPVRRLLAGQPHAESHLSAPTTPTGQLAGMDHVDRCRRAGVVCLAFGRRRPGWSLFRGRGHGLGGLPSLG